MDWFGDYYGIPYPEQKLDQAAIPDFAQGAMENTGLVTYRETLLLLDPAQAAHEERLDVAETVAHELAHMWFGDLVTMRWWNGIWLNEAFATFMSYLCVDAMEPSWRVFDSFQAIRMTAFEVDSLATTRPIEFPVESPDEASGMFDTLTYTKGGAVLRMIEQWLGPERFRDGIRRYLATHAYGNTETHHLWDALEEQSGQPVRRIMDAWIFQPGYPAIDVHLRRRRRAAHAAAVRALAARRRHDLARPADRAAATRPTARSSSASSSRRTGSTSRWRTPMRWWSRTPGPRRSCGRSTTTSSARGSSRTWTSSRRPSGRASSMTRGRRWSPGGHEVGTFLDLVLGFADETAPAVWQTIMVGLAWCDRFLDGEPRERFRDAVRELVRPALGRLGWESRPEDSDLDRELRGDLIRTLGHPRGRPRDAGAWRARSRRCRAPATAASRASWRPRSRSSRSRAARTSTTRSWRGCRTRPPRRSRSATGPRSPGSATRR